MDELFDKIKEQAYNLKDVAVKVTKTVVDKTNNVASQTKIKFAISETQDKVKNVYAEIGEMVYEKYKSTGEICDCMEDKCSMIDTLMDEIADLKEQLSKLKETVNCPNCDASNNVDDIYCSKCGEKISPDEEFDEEFEDDVIIINPKTTDDED